MIFLDVSTAALRVTDTLSFQKKRNVLLPAKTVILGCSWVASLPLMACKIMHQIVYDFYLSFK